jgi:sulfonate dioxygenase
MPTATETVTMTKPQVSYDINLPYTELTSAKNTLKYPQYLPTWEKVWYDPLPHFPFEDPALRVKDKTKPNLLTDGVTVTDIQPRMGSVVNGLQLNRLTDAQKDELALLVSERKVVAFPDQDLIDDGPAAQSEFMKYFGKLNYQPVSGTVKGYPGFHIIHRDGNKEEIAKFFEAKATSTLWHQDVSYEIQPPGYVMLGLLQGPDVGGDTVFAATDEAYR